MQNLGSTDIDYNYKSFTFTSRDAKGARLVVHVFVYFDRFFVFCWKFPSVDSLKSVCKTNQCLLVEFTTLVEFTKKNNFFSSRHFSFLTTNNNFSTFWCWCFQPQFVSKKVENLRICGPVFEFFWQKKKFFGEKNSFWRCWSLSSWFWFYENHWQIFCFFRKQKAAKRLQNRQKLFFRQIPFFLPKKSKKVP